MKKILIFTFWGEEYQVNEKGEIKTYRQNGKFSPTWIFLGGSTHLWHKKIVVSLKEAFENPEKLNNCYGWGLDNGTVMVWRSVQNGKISRISGAYIKEVPNYEVSPTSTTNFDF